MQPAIVETIFYIYDYNFSALMIVKWYIHTRNSRKFARDIFLSFSGKNISEYSWRKKVLVK